MSAMPHAHQMELVLENLSARQTDAAPQKLGLQPQWRVVSRDGSTSSVTGPLEESKHECPDCVAGRCGQNPQGCQCPDGAGKLMISLERLTEPLSPAKQPARTGEPTTGPSMPRAKPQLFEKAAGQPATVSHSHSADRERETFIAQVVTSNAGAEPRPAPVSRSSNRSTPDYPAPAVSAPPPPGDDLRKVIDLWPGLPGRTRRAILALVDTSSEADSA